MIQDQIENNFNQTLPEFSHRDSFSETCTNLEKPSDEPVAVAHVLVRSSAVDWRCSTFLVSPTKACRGLRL